jgi:hypothetical protein
MQTPLTPAALAARGFYPHVGFYIGSNSCGQCVADIIEDLAGLDQDGTDFTRLPAAIWHVADTDAITCEGIHLARALAAAVDYLHGRS